MIRIIKLEYYTCKNHETQSLINQCWRIRLGKKIIQKDPKLKISIKRIRIKIEIKNKLDDNYKFSIEKWNLKENHFNKRTKKKSKEWVPN